MSTSMCLSTKHELWLETAQSLRGETDNSCHQFIVTVSHLYSLSVILTAPKIQNYIHRYRKCHFWPSFLVENVWIYVENKNLSTNEKNFSYTVNMIQENKA